jgi:hypothetical protein
MQKGDTWYVSGCPFEIPVTRPKQGYCDANIKEAKTTTDHRQIQKWVESRGGKPATVKRTGHGDEPGVLRIDFPGYSGEETLEEIPWNEFFEKFDQSKLAFLYQDETAGGGDSRFCKFVARDAAK